MSRWRSLRSWLTGPRVQADRNVFGRQRAAAQIGQRLVWWYYALLTGFAVSRVLMWRTYVFERPLEPVWPLAWMSHLTSTGPVTCFILGFSLVAAMLAFVQPGRRWARLLAWAGAFLVVALHSSRAKMGHAYYIWVLTSFMWIFLPDGGRPFTPWPRQTRQHFLLVFWMCQALVLLTYSMSGAGKILEAMVQWRAHQVHAFSPEALALHAASKVIEMRQPAPLAGWLIAHPYWGWPCMVTTIYLELFSLVIAFRPALHRAWALLLMAFHAGAYAFMGIYFYGNVLVLGILFLWSPFRISGRGGRGTWRELPLMGDVIGRRGLTRAGGSAKG